MYNAIYAALLLLCGATIGVSATLIFRKDKNSKAISDSLQTVSNFAQSISVIVAMGALLVSLNIGAEQNKKQKNQYTRDFLSSQMTSEQRTLTSNLEDFSMLGTVMGYNSMRNLPSMDHSWIGAAFIGGEEVSTNQFPQLISKKLLYISGNISKIRHYLQSVSSCISSGACDKEIATDDLCRNALTIYELADELKRGDIIDISMSEFYISHPDVKKEPLEQPAMISGILSSTVSEYVDGCPAIKRIFSTNVRIPQRTKGAALGPP